MSQQPAIDLKRLLQPAGQIVSERSKLAFAASLADGAPEVYTTPAPPLVPLLASLAARLRETHLYSYLECGKHSGARMLSGLGQKFGLNRRRLFQACALLLPCLAIALTANIWLKTLAGPELYLLRQKLDPIARAEAGSAEEALGNRLFPSQSEMLSRLAETEDSLFFRRQHNWRISRKIVPLSFASSLPDRETRPVPLAWSGREAPAPQGSLLSLGKKSPLFRTLVGVHALPQATDFAFSGPSEPYAANQMQRIATGEQAVESLLAEFRDNPDLLRGRFVALRAEPANDGGVEDVIWSEKLAWTGSANWLDSPVSERMIRAGDSASGLTSGLQCRSDRMELASWLGEMRRESLSLALRHLERASKYSNYVERYSTDYELPPSLVYAIMRTESSFDPNAVSIANALGLMQVVPHTAGGEVYAFLTGKNGTPGREVLFRPESNIQYGTAYLHLLNSRHFKDVENHICRELCIIAAYNGGPNAVLRSFDRDKAKAVAKINQFTPEQLYTTLVRQLPSQETRDYVVKVVEARNKFRHNLSF